MSEINFFIISGTSGSGKTIALQVLEDLGFYCIDNLPASLLPEMASRAVTSDNAEQQYAVSIDSRNQDFIGDLKSHFASLSSLNIDYRVIFLDADDDTLLQRYSETRRKHPLSDKHTSLQEAIIKERKLLEHIADIAHWQVNTANTTPHELRSNIRNYAASNNQGSMTLLFQSFGFKHGSPGDADFVFDVRCLPNPHWDPELRALTGLDPAVYKYLSEQDMCIDMYERIRDFIEHWLPSFVDDNRNYMTVAIGCTGGQHRSVFLSDLLRRHFSGNKLVQTQVRHRELNL
ncbi:MAG: RNase adapter RapZ [Pseudomonadota bacterium]